MPSSTTSVSAAGAQSSPAANHPSFSETLAGLQQSQPEDQHEIANGTPARPLSQPGLSGGAPAANGQATGDGSSSSHPETQSSSRQPQITASEGAGAETRQSVEDTYEGLASLSQLSVSKRAISQLAVSEPIASQSSISQSSTSPASISQLSTNQPLIGQPTIQALSKHALDDESSALDETIPAHQAAIAAPTSVSTDKSKSAKGAATISKFARVALEVAADPAALPAPAAGNNLVPASVSNPVASSSSEVASLAEPDKSSQPKSTNSKVDLAFAVKIQGSSRPDLKNQTSTDSSPAESTDQPSAGPSALAMKSTLGESESKSENSGLADKVSGKTASLENPETPAAGLTGSQAQPAAASAKPDVNSAKQAITSPADASDDGRTSVPSLKAVQVQLTADNNQRVDLRLIEKSGALSISVRSTDGALTKALQQQLPELSSKLSDQQVRAEWWTPSLQKTEAAQSPKDSSSGSGGQPANQDQSNQNKGNSGQQSGRGTQEPDWVEELADLRKSIQNGAQYRWHL